MESSRPATKHHFQAGPVPQLLPLPLLVLPVPLVLLPSPGQCPLGVLVRASSATLPDPAAELHLGANLDTLQQASWESEQLLVHAPLLPPSRQEHLNATAAVAAADAAAMLQLQQSWAG